jgi:hypothetical protein
MLFATYRVRRVTKIIASFNDRSGSTRTIDILSDKDYNVDNIPDEWCERNYENKIFAT